MSRLERLHRVALIAFAIALGLLEGPAEIVCAVLVLTTGLTGRLRGVRWSHPAFIGLAIWWLAGVPGVLTIDAHVSSQGYLRPLHALALLVGGFALRGVPDRVLGRMAWGFGAAMVLNGAYGLLQAAVGPLPLDDVLMFTKGSPQIFVPGSRTVRCASGLFYNRIRLAHVGVMGLALLSVVATAHATRRVRGLATLGVAILGAGVLLTYARMVLVAFVAGALLLVLLSSKPRRASLLAAASLALGLGVSLTDAGQQRLARSLEDLQIRARIFSMASEIIAGHPFFGTGHGAYTVFSKPMLRPTWSRNWTVDAHNLYLHTLAETGIFGALGFLLAVGLGFWPLLRSARRDLADSSFPARLRRLSLLVLLVLLVLGLLHQPLHHASVGLGFWFAIGVGAFSRWREREPDEQP